MSRSSKGNERRWCPNEFLSDGQENRSSTERSSGRGSRTWNTRSSTKSGKVRFQRSLALIAGLSSAIAGLEVSYEHYRGSYSNPVMYTPVILSGALFVSGVAGGSESPCGPHDFARRVRHYSCRLPDWIRLSRARDTAQARRLAPARVQHGYGPANFCAALIRNERVPGFSGFVLETRRFLATGSAASGFAVVEIVAAETTQHHEITMVQELREGRFQRHLAVATAAAAFFSGIEALYSHYKNNFKYKAQWSPDCDCSRS